MEDRERQRELRDERYHDWQTRKRDPGDLVTWAVVLGGLLAVLLLFCAAYDGNTLLGLATAILFLAWVLVTWILGGVNVLSVMWGRTVAEKVRPEQARIVFAASAVLAVVAIALPLIDSLSSLEFGIYGLVAGVAGIVYFLMLWRGMRRTIS